MITPEIAAFVVKEYLLPMFESDGKRLLAKKHKNKIGAAEEEAAPETMDQLMTKDYDKINLAQFSTKAPVGTNKTVFGELKLSQILLGDIDVYKSQITASNERHQKDEAEIAMLTKNLKEQNRIIHKLKLQYK